VVDINCTNNSKHVVLIVFITISLKKKNSFFFISIDYYEKCTARHYVRFNFGCECFDFSKMMSNRQNTKNIPTFEKYGEKQNRSYAPSGFKIVIFCREPPSTQGRRNESMNQWSPIILNIETNIGAFLLP